MQFQHAYDFFNASCFTSFRLLSPRSFTDTLSSLSSQMTMISLGPIAGTVGIEVRESVVAAAPCVVSRSTGVATSFTKTLFEVGVSAITGAGLERNGTWGLKRPHHLPGSAGSRTLEHYEDTFSYGICTCPLSYGNIKAGSTSFIWPKFEI